MQKFLARKLARKFEHAIILQVGYIFSQDLYRYAEADFDCYFSVQDCRNAVVSLTVIFNGHCYSKERQITKQSQVTL